MTELDEVWSEMLDHAARRAAESGRGDVAAYLTLKAANDEFRRRGTQWLLESLVEIATGAMGEFPRLIIEREAPHSFSHGTSNMVGSLVRLRHGVRCLSIEAGWARTPADGIMRNRALAVARILHFGFPKRNAEIRLLRNNSLPYWIGEEGHVIDTSELERHFRFFIGG